MDILVTGGTGQVGLELQALAPPERVRLHAPPRSVLDLESPSSIAAVLASRRWSAVINTAAYTEVDEAQSDVAQAWKVNALGAANLASATAAADIPLVHVSTDYVFDGSKAGYYEEVDAVAPLNVYGASKEGGEQAVRTANRRHAIIRTAWVVSPHRSNFLKTMLRLSEEKPVLRIVDDQRGCPTSATDLAQALLKVAIRLADDSLSPTGTYHFVNAGETTWYGFAAEIFRLPQGDGTRSPRLEAITTAEYPTAAPRPANSRLATAKIAKDFDIRPRPWQAAIADVIHQLAGKAGSRHFRG